FTGKIDADRPESQAGKGNQQPACSATQIEQPAGPRELPQREFFVDPQEMAIRQAGGVGPGDGRIVDIIPHTPTDSRWNLPICDHRHALFGGNSLTSIFLNFTAVPGS